MTVEHIAMVYAAGGMSASEKHLLGAYCNHTDAHGYCWPGVDRLADETGMSPRTVQRTNVALRDMNLIKSVHRTNPKTGEQITNLTRVNLTLLASMRRPERAYDDNLVDAITFAEGDTGDDTFSQVRSGRQYDAPRGDNLTGGGRHSDTPRGDRLTPKTSLETSVEPPPPTPRESQAPQPPVAVREEEERSAGTSTATDEAFALVDAAVALWEGHRPPSRAERLRIAERATQALSGGASPESVSYALTRDLRADQVRTTAVQVVMGRTARPGWAEEPVPAPRSSAPAERPEWCGHCDEEKRLLEDEDGRPRRCPDCHPLRVVA